jgi:hypothetical protein
MELNSKKTTILLPPRLHRNLAKIAKAQRTSIGDLVRRACLAQYGHFSVEERVRAAKAMAALSLPVGTPEQMKRESIPRPQSSGLPRAVARGCATRKSPR